MAEVVDRQDYLPVSLSTISIDSVLGFDLFQCNDGSYRLYRRKSVPLSQDDFEKLHNGGIENLYVPASQKKQLLQHTRLQLPTMLRDENLPVQAKLAALRDTSIDVLGDLIADPTSTDAVATTVEQCDHHVTMAAEGDEARKAMLRQTPQAAFPVAHALNVGNLAILLGLRCGFDDPVRLHELGVGALLHEIGKTVIDHKYYQRGTRIVDSRLRSYPLIGKNILEGSGKVSEGALCPVLEHQERLDGSGFPAKLTAEQISTEGRIVGICDFYDESVHAHNPAARKSPFRTLMEMRQAPRKFDGSILVELIRLLGGELVAGGE